MAMIKCPECKKKISDKAEKCPHCGLENIAEEHKKKKSNKMLWVYIILLLAIIGSFTNKNDVNRKHVRHKTKVAKQIKTENVPKVSNQCPAYDGKPDAIERYTVEKGCQCIGINNNCKNTIRAFITMVRMKGYRCDSVSSVSKELFGSNLLLSCNQYSYKYEIEDRGGKLILKVND